MNKSIESRLELLTSAVERLVNTPIAPVAAVAPIAPILPIAPIDDTRLTRVEVKVDQIQTTLQEIKDGTAHRIDKLETEKLNLKDSYPVLYKVENDRINADHEVRVRSLEKSQWKLVGVSSTIASIISAAVLFATHFL